MKYIIVFLIMIFGYNVICAQSWNFGIEAGYIHNSLSVEHYKATGYNGYKVGCLIDFSLKNNFVFESGISYLRKGGEISSDEFLHKNISKIDFAEINYIQIPLTVGYRFKPIKEITIIPQIGGYCAVGLDGHSFVTGIDSFNQPYEARVSTFSDNSQIPYRPCNRNDVGIALAINLKYKHIGVKIGYDIALTNFSLYGNSKHRTFNVSAVYCLK